MLKSFPAMTLSALSTALRQYDSTLPDHFVQQIHQVAQDLEKDLSPDNECESLYDLVDELEENPDYNSLFALYKQEYRLLLQPDLHQERNKAAPPDDDSELPPSPDYLKNTSANIEFLKNYSPKPSPESSQDSAQS